MKPEEKWDALRGKVLEMKQDIHYSDDIPQSLLDQILYEMQKLDRTKKAEM